MVAKAGYALKIGYFEPERILLLATTAPKTPAPPSGIAVVAANVLASAFGIEPSHRRAMRAHADVMMQWRETCRELQDSESWEKMKDRSAMAQLVRRLQPKRAASINDQFPVA